MHDSKGTVTLNVSVKNTLGIDHKEYYFQIIFHNSQYHELMHSFVIDVNICKIADFFIIN